MPINGGPWTAYNVKKGRTLKHWEVDTGTGIIKIEDAAYWQVGHALLVAAAPRLFAELKEAHEKLQYLAPERFDDEEHKTNWDTFMSRIQSTLKSVEQ